MEEVGVQMALATVTLLADTFDEARYTLSPLYSAVMLPVPAAEGVHEHVATELKAQLQNNR